MPLIAGTSLIWQMWFHCHFHLLSSVALVQRPCQQYKQLIILNNLKNHQVIVIKQTFDMYETTHRIVAMLTSIYTYLHIDY